MKPSARTGIGNKSIMSFMFGKDMTFWKLVSWCPKKLLEGHVFRKSVLDI